MKDEIIIPDPVTITETVTEKEVIMPRIDSTEIVSIAEIATKTIVQIQVGQVNENDEFISVGGGSGVVISAEGLIITNHHVIDDANSVRVIFEDGRMYKAEIIGSDQLTDIGLVKIESSSLTPIVIGNSDILLGWRPCSCHRPSTYPWSCTNCNNWYCFCFGKKT